MLHFYSLSTIIKFSQVDAMFLLIYVSLTFIFPCNDWSFSFANSFPQYELVDASGQLEATRLLETSAIGVRARRRNSLLTDTDRPWSLDLHIVLPFCRITPIWA
jgi:hypothetical protein